MHPNMRAFGPDALLPIVLVLFVLATRPVEAQDTLRKPIVYSIPGMNDVEVSSNLTYKTADGTDLKMDIYVPPGLSADAHVPAIVFIHGGYLSRGLTFLPKDWGVYLSYGRLAAASGLIGVTFNHRYWGWTREDMERSFGDVTDAIDYVRAHADSYHVNPNRLCLWAFSGGGPHLSVALRNRMDYVRCLVSFYAILKVSIPPYLAYANQLKDSLDEFSPMAYLRDDLDFPPIFIGRAGLDSPGINGSVDQFVARALAGNVAIEVANHPNGRHGFDILDDDARSRDIIARAIEFIKVHVREDLESASFASAAKLQSILLSGGVDKARALYREAISGHPGAKAADSPYAHFVSEQNLNLVGYRLLEEKKPQAAVDVFRWVAEMHPDSASASDSLAAGYEALGSPEQAIACSEKALTQLEKAKDMPESLRNRIRQSSTDRIKRLKGRE